MSLQFNPFTGTFDVTTKGDTGAVAAAGDGTAAAPGITFASDTNTGIYRPGEDQLALSTNGVQRINIEADGDINIDSGGVFYDATNNRLAIGTTSPQGILDLTGTSRIVADVSGATPKFTGLNAAASAQVELALDGSALAFRTFGAEKAKITSSGQLLVGTSSSANNANDDTRISVVKAGTDVYPNIRLTAYSGNNSGPAPVINFNRSKSTTDGGYTEVSLNDALGYLVFSGADGVGWSEAAYIAANADGDWTTSGDTTDSPGRLVFATTADGAASPTERMRLTSTGFMLLGTTSDVIWNTTGTGVSISSNAIQVSRNGDACLLLNRTSSDGNIQVFARQGSTVGTINVSTSSTSYNTSSDYRLKENVTPVTDGITRLQQLKPSRFNFIVDPDKTVDGFLAHEVQTIVPEAITGEKDAVDDDGNPVYQGIDQSKLVPLLTAALQEAIAKIESLEARLDAANL